MLPIPGHKITTRYGKRGKYWSLRQDSDPLRMTRRGKNGRRGWGIHTGTDFAAKYGTPIHAATPGTVIASNAYDRAYGYKVIIRWGGFDVWYCHMPKGAATVKVGQKVNAGDRIGAVGDTGNVSGAHLHLELRLAGGGFTSAAIRNPQPAIDYTPDTPKPDDRRWFKLTLVNHGAATAALKKPGAKAKWYARRARLVNAVLDVNADVIVGLEVGGTKSPNPWHYLTTKYAKHGNALVPSGSEGKHLWRKLTTVGVPEATGHIDTPKHLRVKGNNMPAPWMIAPIDGTLGMVVGFHLDYRATDNGRVAVAKHLIDEAEKIAAKHGIGKSRIVFAGDTASDNWVREKAFKARGYRDVFAIADKTVNAVIKSYNKYKPAKPGPRVDLIAVYGDDKRPIAAASLRLDSVATDHHVMSVVIERQ